MMPYKSVLSWLSIIAIAHGFTAPALAQITAADDGTNTRVSPNGNQLNISGGSFSSDGANQFHSFDQFNLNANQIANFQTNPQLQNVLSRVVGGDASVINGLIRLTGSEANLYLINPAGMIFGGTAQLDVPGAFTATTANGIGFGDDWFDAVGANDYATLTGNPETFAFTTATSGSIVNAGDLAVETGHSLMLLGGTVINTGTLTAPSGEITIAAVPGEQLVRVSQDSMLLSLELETITANSELNESLDAIPFSPLSLPDLLTGTGMAAATEIAVNPDGTVRLMGSSQEIAPTPGMAISSGEVDVSGAMGGSINVLGDRVGVINGVLDASGLTGGGTVRIGGEYQGQGSLLNAARTVVDEGSTIAADAINSGGGGRVIVWADEMTSFEGSITARGGQASGDGGFVEVSGKEYLVFDGLVDTSAVNGQTGTLLLDPTNIEVVASGGTATSLTDVDAFGDPDLGPGASTTIDAALINAATSNVILQATNDITFNANINIAQPLVDLTAEAGNNIVVNSNITTNGGDVTLTADADGGREGAVSITGATIATQGGDFNASGVGNSDLTDGIFIEDSAISTSNGNINLDGIALTGGSFGDRGVEIASSNLLASGLGDINITGQGGIDASGSSSGTTANHGIMIRNDSTLRVKDGNIIFTGTSGNGRSDIGVAISSGSFIESTGLGNIEFLGASISTSGFSAGVSVFNASGNNSGNRDLKIQTNDGNIKLIGLGDDNGVIVGNDSSFEIRISTINGNINIIGKNDSSVADSIRRGGVSVVNINANPVIIESLGEGNIYLQANSPSSEGVYLVDTAVNSLGSGSANITASQDIVFEQSTILGELAAQSDLGNISVTGNLGGDTVLSLAAENGTVEFNDAIGIDESGNINPLLGLDISARDATIQAVNLGAEGLTIKTSGNIAISDTLRVLDSGSVDVFAGQSILANSIFTVGGVVSLESFNGDISTSAILTRNVVTGNGVAGNGGDIEIRASGNIITKNLETNSTVIGSGNAGNGGDITVEAGGTLTIEGQVDSRSQVISPTAGNRAGNGGAITFNANEQILIDGRLISLSLASGASQGTGGAIRITSRSDIELRSGSTLATPQSINTRSLNQSGSVFIDAARSIDFIGEDERPGSNSIRAGNVTFNAGEQINIDLLVDDAVIQTDGGRLTISAQDDITVRNARLVTSSLIGGRVALSSTNGAVRIGDIDSRGTSFNGGTVTVQALTEIEAGFIDTSSATFNGGSVFLDPIGDIQVEAINAQGGTNGRGGTVDITAGRFFRATDSFIDQNGRVSSISTAGGLGGSPITIRHGGGSQTPRRVPFVVGNARRNGTAAAITSGEFTLAPTEILPNSITEGNIRILTQDPPPLPTPPVLNLPDWATVENDPHNITNFYPPDSDSPSDVSWLTPADRIIAIEDQWTEDYVAHLNIPEPDATPTAPKSDGIPISLFPNQPPSSSVANQPSPASSTPSIRPDSTNPSSDQSNAVNLSSPGSDPSTTPSDPAQPVNPNEPQPDTPETDSPSINNSPDYSANPTAPDSGAVSNDPDSPSPSGSTPDLDPSTPPSAGEADPPVDPSPDNPTPNDTSDPSEPSNSDDPGLAPGTPTPDMPDASNNSSESEDSEMSIEDIQTALQDIEAATGVRPALIYGVYAPNNVLELLLVTAHGDVIRQPIPGANRSVIEETVKAFRVNLNLLEREAVYLEQAQQLYHWLVEPLEAELQNREINNLVFLLDAGLRSVPLAALHDGQGYIVERYSVGLMPTLSLTNTEYRNINDADMLAMGSSEFRSELNLSPLPAAQEEITLVSQQIWQGRVFPNDAFTLSNLRSQREQTPYGLIHLATHADFEEGNLDQSYIQLWDTRLRLDQIRELGWHEPPVELVVLSACQTALGNDEAELGFAGFAALAGAKSVLASLWSVNDVSTLGLMAEFYQQMRVVPIKAEALRQAQIAMLSGQVQIENGDLVWADQRSLLSDELEGLSNRTFEHPYYWAGFTMIGSPW